MNEWTIGQILDFNVRKLIDEDGFFIKDFEEEAGLSRGFINSLKKTDPKISSVLKIAKYCRVTVEELTKQPTERDIKLFNLKKVSYTQYRCMKNIYEVCDTVEHDELKFYKDQVTELNHVDKYLILMFEKIIDPIAVVHDSLLTRDEKLSILIYLKNLCRDDRHLTKLSGLILGYPADVSQDEEPQPITTVEDVVAHTWCKITYPSITVGLVTIDSNSELLRLFKTLELHLIYLFSRTKYSHPTVTMYP